ncbi:hypothetical protein BCR44DRAFT_38181 [Catenaria anguillulae PL171]|uniref:UspA domain-containing protein n=1 Tax=Catenaria anguillulae PL171 TaxID=765915 RepID=A0A1Y2HGJ2_9FUNG|nr:hypothetical protein BCR44DRAFT_38181 [Catenaria anguillulae PL171]
MFYEDMVASKSNVREEIVADAMKTAQKFVDKSIESRLDKFKINVFVEVKVGDAREIIVDSAKQVNAAAVVMGSRGRNAIARFVLGSVSDYVTQHCPAPVVVIRSGPMPTSSK